MKTVDDLIKFIEDNQDAGIFVGKNLYKAIKSLRKVKEETVNFCGLEVQLCTFLGPNEIVAVKTPEMFCPFEKEKDLFNS